jgi:hypothetical protein
MSVSIELTPAQVAALADIVKDGGGISLRQLAPGATGTSTSADVYATPVGSRSGVRIAPDGSVSDMGETLPAEG